MAIRFMRGNQGTETPSNLIFFDTESHKKLINDNPKRWELTLRLWCVTHVRLDPRRKPSRTEYSGTTSEEFWKLVYSLGDEKKCTWVFAHNIAHDWNQIGFWSELDRDILTLRPLFRKDKEGNDTDKPSWYGKLCLENNPTFAQLRQGQATYKFVDTCNYWPKSLAEIGRKIGVEKGEVDYETVDNDTLRKYCQQDVLIIETAVIEMLRKWRELDCGVFQVTAAMLSLTNFRHTCDIRTPDNSGPDVLCMPDHKSHELERQSLHGGRIQCFRVGRYYGKFYHLDVNGLYPYVMYHHSYPRRLVRYQERMDFDELRAAKSCYECVARVLISSRYSDYPVRIDSRQYHVTGRFWTALCGGELQRAIDNQHISEVGTVQLYSKASLFRSWVDRWYDRKISACGDTVEQRRDYEFVKLIINSLSGKFAQSGKRWQDVPGRIPLVRWGGYVDEFGDEKRPHKWRGIAGNAQVYVDAGEPEHSFPLITACITANAREYMRQLIAIAGQENCHYMATDSLIVNKDGYMSLLLEEKIHPTKMGMMKVLGVYSSVSINGANWYTLDNKEVASGMLGKAIKAKLDKKPLEKWDQLLDHISTGPLESTHIQEVECPAICPDYRGVIDPDGYWRPYNVSFREQKSDRIPQYHYSFVDSLGKEQDRILQDASLSRPISPVSRFPAEEL